MLPSLSHKKQLEWSKTGTWDLSAKSAIARTCWGRSAHSPGLPWRLADLSKWPLTCLRLIKTKTGLGYSLGGPAKPVDHESQILVVAGEDSLLASKPTVLAMSLDWFGWSQEWDLSQSKIREESEWQKVKRITLIYSNQLRVTNNEFLEGLKT